MSANDDDDKPTAGAKKTELTGASSSANDEKVAHHFKKILTDTKVEGGKSAWATTLETVGMSDGGKKKKGDVLHDTLEEAMNGLRALAAEKNWDFDFEKELLKDFSATKDDILRAFVLWSQAHDEDEKYNVSKALRRLKSYYGWMEKNSNGLELRGSTMYDVADIWKMQILTDKEGRLVWWIDVGLLDLHKIKHEVPHDDTLRYFIWLSHLVMLDPVSQEKGLIFCEGMGDKGMIECLTALSMDLGTKIDRLTIGILPIRIEKIYMYNNPRWVRFLVALMMPFLGRKIRKRIKIISAKKDVQAIFEEALGKEAIPVGIAKLQGTVEKDLIVRELEKRSGNSLSQGESGI